MLTETSMLYKLTILYILHRVDFPISNSQISNFILENDFTDYFNIQQIMGELIDDDYVSRETIRNKTLYRISEQGEAALKLLSRELSPSMKSEVDRYISENRMSLREEIAVMGKYVRSDIGHFDVTLYIDENNDRIFELNLIAASEQEADKLCAGWQKHSGELYPHILSTLLS